jgi:hypothetical protein
VTTFKVAVTISQMTDLFHNPGQATEWTRRGAEMVANEGKNAIDVARIFNEQKVGGEPTWIDGLVRQHDGRKRLGGKNALHKAKQVRDRLTGKRDHGQSNRMANFGGVGSKDTCSFLKEVAVTMEAIREFIRLKPFEPSVIRLSYSEAHEIMHPECVAITTSKVVITFPDKDRVVYCSPIHVNAVESLKRD